MPELEAHGLSKEDFVTFIDGLNESFVPHPIFTGLGLAGGIMSAVQGVQPVQLAGIGLQAASVAASGATSYVRTRQYVKAINESYFHPAGLHLHVFDTKKMTAKVNYPEEKLKLPPLDFTTDLPPPIDGMDRKESRQQSVAQVMEQNDPRLRRIKALEGYVLPLDLDVPQPASPDNLLKKMSATKAARLERKQNRKTQKKHAKMVRKQEKAKGIEGEAKLERLESRLEATELELEKQRSGDSAGAAKSLRELERERAKLSRKVDKKSARMEKRALKADTKQPKRERKAEKRLDKLERKESKTANKIRWLVIVRKDEEEDSDQDSIPKSDDEKEFQQVEMKQPA